MEICGDLRGFFSETLHPLRGDPLIDSSPIYDDLEVKSGCFLDDSSHSVADFRAFDLTHKFDLIS